MADMRGEFKTQAPRDNPGLFFAGFIVIAALVAIGAWGYGTDWWSEPHQTQTAEVNPPPVGPIVPDTVPPANPAPQPPNGTIGPNAQPQTGPQGNPG